MIAARSTTPVIIASASLETPVCAGSARTATGLMGSSTRTRSDQIGRGSRAARSQSNVNRRRTRARSDTSGRCASSAQASAARGPGSTRFDASDVAAEDVAGLLGQDTARWPAVLGRPDVRERPDPATWSPLEYACHVRDVFRRYERRLVRMLREDDPLYVNWDQDATAVQERYRAQDPATVAAELVAAGAALAARCSAVRGDEGGRPGRRGDGARFSVDTFSRHLLHDPVHHLHDVTS